MATDRSRCGQAWIGCLLASVLLLWTSAAGSQERTVEPRVVPDAADTSRLRVSPDALRLQPRDCSKIPPLREPTLDAARQLFAKGQPFELRAVERVASERQPGTVLRASSGPLEGNRCWVDLVVSSGPEPAVDCDDAPRLEGLASDELRRVLGKRRAFQVRNVFREESERPAGTVIRQRSGRTDERSCWLDLWVASEPARAREVEVPDVVGLQLREALPRLEPFRVERSYVPGAAPRDEIVDQKPHPPARIAVGSPLGVTVSDGSRMCSRPPKFPERTLDAARRVLAADPRFEIRGIAYEVSAEPEGRILRQQTGALSRERCWVDLWVSSGPRVPPPPPDVDCEAAPRLVGSSTAEARKALGARPEFEVRTTVREASDSPRGVILRQRSGRLDERTCWLDLWVSSGPPSAPTGPAGPTGPAEPTGPSRPTGPTAPAAPAGPTGTPPGLEADCAAVPDFPEPGLEAARQVLVADDRFSLRNVETSASVLPADTILRSASGPLDRRRCWVDLWVSDGSLVTVPAVEGLERSVAERVLRDAGELGAAVTPPEALADWTVLLQDPARGETVPRGSEVRLALQPPPGPTTDAGAGSHPGDGEDGPGGDSPGPWWRPYLPALLALLAGAGLAGVGVRLWRRRKMKRQLEETPAVAARAALELAPESCGAEGGDPAAPEIRVSARLEPGDPQAVVAEEGGPKP